MALLNAPGCWILALASFAMTAAPAAGQSSREYQIKAVFLFNFAQFTDWPADAFADPNSPLIIGILGSDPFGKSLEETVRGELVRGRRIEIEHYRTVEEIKTCHILYISQSEATRLDHIRSALKGKPVLTVSDIEQSAYRGVMIRFLTERNKIRLRVNLEARLTLSSKLLRAAEIVGAEGK